MRLYRIPYSTNVERVALALAHKGLRAEPVDVDPRDRGPVRVLSGQALVPVLELDDGEVVADSLAILRRVDELRPDPPLFPRDRARREELEVFLDWFDAVWKVPPNAIDAELGRLAPDRPRIARLGARTAGWRDRFEALLDGRDFLWGDALGAGDLAAFPFLKYLAVPVGEADADRFHAVLAEHLAAPAGAYPGLRAWIARVDALPRTP